METPYQPRTPIRTKLNQVQGELASQVGRRDGEGYHKGANLLQGPVCQSSVLSIREISSSPKTENRILGDNNRLSGDDSVPASGEGRVDFQKVSGYIVNAGGVIKDLLTLLGTLSSTTLAILPAPLYMRYLQRQQIHKLCLKRDYNSKIALDPSARRN